MKRNESKLQAAFLLAVPREVPAVRVFRRNVAVVRVEGRVIRFGIRGQCDLYAIAYNGLHAEIELKALGGDLAPEQRAWRAWCINWNVPYALLEEREHESKSDTIGRWCRELRSVLALRGVDPFVRPRV